MVGAVAGILSASTTDFPKGCLWHRSLMADYEVRFMRLWINAASLFYYRFVVNLLKKVNENSQAMYHGFAGERKRDGERGRMSEWEKVKGRCL